MLGLLEESLTDSFINDDQSDLGGLLGLHILVIESVLQCHDLVELGQLLIDDLLPHGVTHTISVDENVLWHLPIEVSVALESALEVVREDSR